MAWTTTKTAQYNEGGVVVQHWNLIADAATLELSTGLKNILHLTTGINTATTAGIKFKANILSAGTTAYGNVAITGAASADNLYLTVYGN